MIAWIRQLLAPPVFQGDEDKTHAADLLNTALLILSLGTVLYCAIAPIVATIVIRRLIIGVVLLGLLLGMLFVMRRGYVRLAGAITVKGMAPASKIICRASKRRLAILPATEPSTVTSLLEKLYFQWI